MLHLSDLLAVELDGRPLSEGGWGRLGPNERAPQPTTGLRRTLEAIELDGRPLSEGGWGRLGPDERAPRTAAAGPITPLGPAPTDLVAVLRPHWGTAGEDGISRREKVRALAGFLAKEGWSDNAILAVIDELPTDQLPERRKQARDAASQARTGAVTAGLDALRGLIGEDAGLVKAFVEGPRNSWIDKMKARDRPANDGPRIKPAGADLISPFDCWIVGAESPYLQSEEPPPREWIFKQRVDGQDVGMFPRGECGMLSSAGGVGKTYALIDAAIAVATGGDWLGTFRATEPGHVLLALAEEDRDEMWRRIKKVCQARRFTPKQVAEMWTRLDVLPLAGQFVSLTESGGWGESVGPTAFAHDMQARLESRGVDWSLLIFDPLARWAGGGVEKDNEAATRFTQTVERFARAPGRPGVMMSHHSSQASTKEGSSDARGVTSLRDSFRWHASLDEVEGGVVLKNGKSNYSPRFDPVLLNRGPGGVLARDGGSLKEAQARNKQATTDTQYTRTANRLQNHAARTGGWGPKTAKAWTVDINESNHNMVGAVLSALARAQLATQYPGRGNGEYALCPVSHPIRFVDGDVVEEKE